MAATLFLFRAAVLSAIDSPAASASCNMTAGVLIGSTRAFHHESSNSAADCCAACQSEQRCVAFNYEAGQRVCYFQADALPSPKPPHPNVTSGVIHSEGPAAVAVTVGLVYHRTDPGFRCWTIDASLNRGWEERNLTDPQLLHLAAESFGGGITGYMRFGGGGNDNFDYDVGGKHCKRGDGGVGGGGGGSSSSATPAPLGKQPYHCLNESHFDRLMTFAAASRAKLVFGLSISPRNTTDGRWDPTQARDLIQYAQSRGWGSLFFAFELGNEQNHAYTAREQAQDLVVLQNLLAELWPTRPSDPSGASSSTGAGARPRIIGPDPHGYHNVPTSKAGDKITPFLVDFLGNASALGLELFAVTHHEYVEVAPHLSAPPASTTLDKVGGIGAVVNTTIRSAGFGVPLWVGETGPHNGGSPGVLSDKSTRWTNFADAFWYLDAMASKAASGYAAFCRQDFIGIDYGLLDPATNEPLPDYWAGLLWSRLMGEGVIRVASTHRDTVRAWAHCTAASGSGSGGGDGGVTLLLLNLAPTHAVNVTVAGTTGAVCGAAPGSCARVEYRLSGPRGTDAPVVALNGAVLALGADGRVPALEGAYVPDGTNTITVPPASITFAVLTGSGAASAAGC